MKPSQSVLVVGLAVFFWGLIFWIAFSAREIGSSLMFFSSLPLLLALWLQGRERRASKGQSTPPK